MIIVAPTKKASAVAGRETDSDSSSLHQLLHDYGWRWNRNRAGATEWQCLSPGQLDPITDARYLGPKTALRPGDRIVVDEAGMLDLEAANALMEVVERTGACVALVGDQNQALPVGHSGAMALLWRRAARQVELVTIHRFRDPDWANLTLKLRDPGSQEEAMAVADALIRSGHVVNVNSDVEAQKAMADAWFEAHLARRKIALVTSTHSEAQMLSEAIQARRVADGSISTRDAFCGQSGQIIFVGDFVQTRRNDNIANVQNRENWVVKTVTQDYVMLAAANDSTDLRKVSPDYASAHLHLAYATTVYGVQGETTDLSIVGPGVDAAGLYVGLTRGKRDNRAVVVAATDASARSQLVETMQRRGTEETLEKSRSAARTELNRAAQSVAGPHLVSSPTHQYEGRVR